MTEPEFVPRDGCGIVAFDLALVMAAEAFTLPIVPGELAAAAAPINGISANEFLFATILQVLPARHP